MILRKLTSLRDHIGRMRRRLSDDLEAFRNDVDRQDALAMSLLVAVQDALDIALHMASDEGWGVPASYAGSFSLLARFIPLLLLPFLMISCCAKPDPPPRPKPTWPATWAGPAHVESRSEAGASTVEELDRLPLDAACERVRRALRDAGDDAGVLYLVDWIMGSLYPKEQERARTLALEFMERGTRGSLPHRDLCIRVSKLRLAGACDLLRRACLHGIGEGEGYLLECLARFGNPTDAGMMRAALDHADPRVRLAAIWACGVLRDHQAIGRLREFLVPGDDYAVPLHAALALDRIGDPGLFEALRSGVQTGYLHEIAMAFGAVFRARAVAEVAGDLKSDNYGMRSHAYSVLEYACCPESEDALLECFRNAPDEREKRWILFTLNNCATARVVDTLLAEARRCRGSALANELITRAAGILFTAGTSHEDTLARLRPVCEELGLPVRRGYGGDNGMIRRYVKQRDRFWENGPSDLDPLIGARVTRVRTNPPSPETEGAPPPK